MGVLSRAFVWWWGATPGTLFYTWRNGRLVGQDSFGNRYYQDRTGRRRWVLYEGTVEASRVPPDWHGWLHHTFVDPPTCAPLARPTYEAPYEPNPSGTPGAYRPEGSLWRSGQRPGATGDYEAWQPD